MNTINVENCKTLLIGRRGENEVTTVAFDFTEWASEFGSGVVDLYVKRFGDESAYPVALTIDGEIATWTVTATDTNVAGYGKAEYVYRVDGKIAKSAVFPFFVAEDIGQPASEPPDPYESWLEQLTALGAETEAHAQAAEQSAEDAAESAQEAAGSAASAEGYAGQAETAAGLAQAAQTASESARDAAQTAQASAEASATAASGSAVSAAGSATAAAGSASDASASASAAGASATAAGNAATQAEAAKTAAQTAQSIAEDAAEDAQQAAQQAHVEYEQLSGEVDDLSDEVTQQKSAIEALEDLTNRKAGMLVDTASGAIASFVPDATIPDLLGVSVGIEPVQDLHGQDAPYPPGGGKNLLFCDASKELRVNGNPARTYQNNGLTIKATAVAAFYVVLSVMEITEDIVGNTYVLSSLPNTATIGIYNLSNNNFDAASGAKIRTVVSEDVGKHLAVRFYNDTGADLTWTNCQVELGSTATSFAPYSNICPISGWDSVEVDTAGVNLLAPTEYGVIGYAQAAGTDLKGTYNCPITQITDGYSVSIQTSWTGAVFATGMLPAGTYHVHFKVNDSSARFSVYKASENLIVESNELNVASATTTDKNVTLTKPGRIAVFCGKGSAGTIDVLELQVEVGSTYSSYARYSAQTYPIIFPTEAGTVYGGTLDVTNGTMTVDRAIDVYDGSSDENWAKSGTGSYVLTNSSVKGDTTPISNLYLMQKAPTSGFNIRPIGNDNFASVTEWKTFLSQNNLEVVYELATPITITLDPVTISTISGQTNNVWANTGDVSVEFAADVKTYIDQKIAAAVAALS